MRAVFENPRVATHKGALARRRIAKQFGDAAAARQVAEAIRMLMAGRCQPHARRNAPNRDPVCTRFMRTDSRASQRAFARQGALVEPVFDANEEDEAMGDADDDADGGDTEEPQVASSGDRWDVPRDEI